MSDGGAGSRTSWLARFVQRVRAFDTGGVLAKSFVVVSALVALAAIGGSPLSRGAARAAHTGLGLAACRAALAAEPPRASARGAVAENDGGTQGAHRETNARSHAESTPTDERVGDDRNDADRGARGGRNRATPEDPVILNAATEADLVRLPSVGPKRAQAILELRARLGRFRHVEDLLRVRGIGRATLRKIRPLVRLDPPPPAG